MAFLMFPMGGSVHSEEQPRVTYRFPLQPQGLLIHHRDDRQQPGRGLLPLGMPIPADGAEFQHAPSSPFPWAPQGEEGATRLGQLLPPQVHWQ